MVGISDMDRAETISITDARHLLIGSRGDPMKAACSIVHVKGFIGPKELLAAVKGRVINDFVRCVGFGPY